MLEDDPSEASKTNDEGEKVPVYLKIVNFGQYDKSEKLKKVLRKKATDFEDFLGHGVVPLVTSAGMGDDFKDQLKRLKPTVFGQFTFFVFSPVFCPIRYTLVATLSDLFWPLES